MKGLDYEVFKAKVPVSSDTNQLMDELLMSVGKTNLYNDMLDAITLAAQLGGYHSARSHAEELITNVIVDFWQQEMNRLRQAVLLDSMTKIDTDLIIVDEMAMIQPPKPEKPRFPWFHHNRRW